MAPQQSWFLKPTLNEVGKTTSNLWLEKLTSEAAVSSQSPAITKEGLLCCPPGKGGPGDVSECSVTGHTSYLRSTAPSLGFHRPLTLTFVEC